MTTISFTCPQCRSVNMVSPEELCDHMTTAHGQQDLICDRQFRTHSEYESWISRVEEARSEGGVIGSDDGSVNNDSEFYILCSRKASPQPKRRRLDDGRGGYDHTIVSCTAFVHVDERMDGSVYVRYCLDHVPECDLHEEDHRDAYRPRKKLNVKRRNSETEDMNGASSSQNQQQQQQQQSEVGYVVDQSRDASGIRNLNQVPDPSFLSTHRMQMVSDLAAQIHNRLWEKAPNSCPSMFPRIY